MGTKNNPGFIGVFSIILIACLGIIVYLNTFFASFHFDDVSSIVDNPYIKNISNLQSIWNFWPCRFLTYLSLAFNYHFSGLNVFGYHLFNLAVHLATSILVWWLVRLTLSSPALKENKIIEHANLIALFAGLIFVSHPLQTQAVTYIVQRAASMATLFYVAALCFYIKSRLLQNNKAASALAKIYYICSLMAALMAMFSKEITISLPLMILIYEFYFFKTKKGFDWKPCIPFLFTVFIIPITVFLTGSLKSQAMRGIVPEGPADISSWHYLLTQFRVMVTYIRLLFIPLNQNLDYDYHISRSIFELPTLISFLFLTAILYSAKRLFLKYRLVSFSIFWFFLTLLPESSFFPIRDVIFEHRLYLPMVGYSLFLVSGMYYLYGKKNITVMIIVLTMIIAGNSVLTYQRNRIWRNDLLLWTDTVRKSPHKARPYYNLGQTYHQQGNLIEAMLDYNKAIEIDPQFAEAYNNRGAIYEKQGKFMEAMSGYNKAIEINPAYADAYSNRGLMYNKEGMFAQAVANYDKAIEINPTYTEAYNNRGLAYQKQDDLTQAMSDFTKYIEMNPANAEAYNNRGAIYEKQGSLMEAMADYNRAIAINPRYAIAYNNRGNIYNKQGSFIQAMDDYNKAIEINPLYGEAYNNRGFIYTNEGDFTQAVADYNKAIETNPKLEQVYINRGSVYEKMGNKPQAIADFSKAVEINPKDADTYNNRGNIFNNQGDFKQALSDYNKAIEINPRLGAAYSNRAISYYQLKEYDHAWSDVHQAEALGVAVNPQLISALKEVPAQ